MSSADQEDFSPPGQSEIKLEVDKDVEKDVGVKVKEEPADSGYEKPFAIKALSDNSNSNSRSSSPACPPVHFESESVAAGNDSPSEGAGSDSQPPSNDSLTGSEIRSQLQGGASGKKTDTVQNIVEGLLKKNATLLAMSDTEGLRPQRRYKGQDLSSSKNDQNPPSVKSSVKFPISSTSQARLVQSHGKKASEMSKPMLLRPKSPTKKCDSILRDKSLLSYCLMESPVGDVNAEKIFNVQHHQLVCAVSSKPFIYDKVNNEKIVIASLDNNYFWCNFCSFSTANKSLITNHIMDHRFSCKYCPYESFCRSDILRHSCKMHAEFQDMAENLNYCTFLSDYIRVKTRAEGKENDVDEDVNELDTDAMQSCQALNLKRKHQLDEGDAARPNEKWAKIDSPESASNGFKADRPGKSRKSQNPRKHPQINEKDYDTFEMEVEEIDGNDNASESHTDRVLYPSSALENSKDKNFSRQDKNPSTQAASQSPHMQLIPSLQDEGNQGFTGTRVQGSTPSPRPGRPPVYNANNNRGNNRGNYRTGSASSLYWSCGYCDFQSSSQAEIKEHSNRTHPGKPHRVSLTSHGDAADHLHKSPGNILSGNRENVEFETSPSSSKEVESTDSHVYVNNQEVPHGICTDNIINNRSNSTPIETITLSNTGSESDSEFSALSCQKSLEANCDLSLTLKKGQTVGNDKNINSSCSSLKLTFKTVGDKTVCKMNEECEDPKENESDMSCKNSEKVNVLADGSENGRKQKEKFKDSPNSSFSDVNNLNPQGAALSVSSVGEDFDSNIIELKDKNNAVCKSHLEEPNDQGDCSLLTVTDLSDDIKPVFDFVPARSAAVKAMNKLKYDSDNEESEGADLSKTKKNVCKHRGSDGSSSDYIRDKLCHSSSLTKNAIYNCSYCSNFLPSSLRKVKSHLVNHHPNLLPVVVNVKIKQSSKKKNTFYVCPFSSCNKLFSIHDALLSHKSSHSSLAPLSIKQEKLTGNSSFKNISCCQPLCVPSGCENIPNCKVLLKPLDSTQLEASLPSTSSSISSDSRNLDDSCKDRYQCLHCTEYFSHHTLSGMKCHYAAEHSGQLLVIRDVEAKKEKQVSRIYACEEFDCAFTSASRVEVESHAKCHKSDCTYVYECAGCGWYSSSFWSAKDHLKNEHSSDESVDLIHMLLSVDEHGHTSKKILRSV